MDSRKAFEIIPGSSVAEYSPNLTDEDSSIIPQLDEAVHQVGEVSNEIATNIPKLSEEKNAKQPLKEEKLSLKRKITTKELPGERKKAKSPPISQMVMESIKALRKRNGASVEDILEHMEEQYKVNAKLVKRYVSRFLLSGVQKDIIEQLIGAKDSKRFKIKKAEKVTKNEKELKANQKMVKAEKDAKIYQNLDQKKIKEKKVAKADKNQN